MITILGPTAGGKTSVAANLAYRINGEVISADSRQVYRGMDIGTGKDICDYTVNETCVPYHLIDIVDAGYKYSVFEFQRDFLKSYHDIRERGCIPVLCGGTGLYIEAVVNGYNLLSVPPNEDLRKNLEQKNDDELVDLLTSLKKLHNKTDIDSRKRIIRAIEIELYLKDHVLNTEDYPQIYNIYFGIKYDRETRRQRITQRLHERLKNGLIEEVEGLLQNGITPDDLFFYGLEYKYLTLYITGQINYSKMVEYLNIAIHQFAKRQMTWFRGMERKGATIHWIDGHLAMEEKIEMILQVMYETENGKPKRQLSRT
ncbi:MAG: tRNA (adenosine(37)-N6)-dimethylallyltransferase MiaA [Prevotellaceae bacterium]|jgi:tRNA dimethylallyltransferase|nr:tRNA (adenosine(37)-N6)-dimethylallyltransferase MiaA [Prevotellaceae bacterium]